MKTLIISAALVVTTVLGTSCAGTRNPSARAKAETNSVTAAARLERMGVVVRASDLLGREVKNEADERVGKVAELAVDLETGRVTEVVVAVGGMLGMGNVNVAVPPRLFRLDVARRQVQLNVSSEKLKGAPQAGIPNWETDFNTNRLAEIDRYYGEVPSTEVSIRTSMTTNEVKAPRLTYRERASKLIGRSVENSDGQKLGKVQNLIVDLVGGRVVHAVISSGGLGGIGDELSAVPATALRYNRDHTVVLLEVSKDALARAPHFKSGRWPDWDTKYSASVYRAYGVEPYFLVDGEKKALDPRPNEAGKLTAIDQGTAPTDLETTRNIRKAIVARKDLSMSAHNVQIITLNGRVTLRGQVKTPGEKTAVAEIAERNSGPGKVDNQLEAQAER